MLLASFFNKKGKKWVLGRENWQTDLSQKINKNESYCWIHCASAGEFEQAIPLVKELRTKNKEQRIAVSFFSPSGFELYKDSDEADLFFYFPLDTKSNAGKLVEILNPDFVIFIRNEIWWNILSSLKQKNIPTYLVNVNLEQQRSFFYQKYLNKTYLLFTKIFDIKTFGNTKLEKVTQNKNEIFSDAILENFCKDSFVVILGSSWLTEEKFIAEFYKKNKSRFPNLKIIIAPHEFDKTKETVLENLFDENIISYSKHSVLTTNYSLLFLAKKGILKYAYRYTDIAVIGGGFEKTVHNVSEAAVYSIPTIFGTNYSMFEEVNDLVTLQVAFSVNDYESFENKLIELITNNELRNSVKEKTQVYFSTQENVSGRIIDEILFHAKTQRK